jgi:hypothetical protein
VPSILAAIAKCDQLYNTAKVDSEKEREVHAASTASTVDAAVQKTSEAKTNRDAAEQEVRAAHAALQAKQAALTQLDQLHTKCVADEVNLTSQVAASMQSFVPTTLSGESRLAKEVKTLQAALSDAKSSKRKALDDAVAGLEKQLADFERQQQQFERRLKKARSERAEYDRVGLQPAKEAPAALEATLKASQVCAVVEVPAQLVQDVALQQATPVGLIPPLPPAPPPPLRGNRSLRGPTLPAGKKASKTKVLVCGCVLATIDAIAKHMQCSSVGEVKYDPNGKIGANLKKMHWMEKPDCEMFTNINPPQWPTKSIQPLMLYLGNWTKLDPEYREYVRLRTKIMDTNKHAALRKKKKQYGAQQPTGT